MCVCVCGGTSRSDLTTSLKKAFEKIDVENEKARTFISYGRNVQMGLNPVSVV